MTVSCKELSSVWVQKLWRSRGFDQTCRDWTLIIDPVLLLGSWLMRRWTMKRSYHFTTSVWRQAATPSCRTNWICLSFFNVSELQLKPVPVWWRLIKNIKSKCGSSGPWHTVTHSNRICYSELTQGSGEIHGRLRSCFVPAAFLILRGILYCLSRLDSTPQTKTRYGCWRIYEGVLSERPHHQTVISNRGSGGNTSELLFLSDRRQMFGVSDNQSFDKTGWKFFLDSNNALKMTEIY